ncbi:RHS repeat-associated core domain-containing protein [Streptomyces sp. TS71-3]|uniref:RHS repeat-associated core domain-containing protein n=1 Tax=Streptomyces sp. TS71-3 TaxID=2733862 RepID=UPI001BB2EF20|nr:RHS repeat-associated core domain-containing protein [Streptomyces sp. TS71-3]
MAQTGTDHAIYAYDAADRLVGVTDPAGETARYRYDEVGNRLGVDRYPSSKLSVLSVVPARAPVGATVTLSGTGFSATASGDAVSFGGAKASVTSASATRLVVTVPSGAADGKVSVAVGGVTAESTEAFTVAAGAPVVSKLTPSSGVPGTQVVLSGSGFAANATDNVVRFNGGTSAQLVSATSTSVTVKVPQGATTGRVEVETPDGRGVSSGDFTVPLAGDDFETSVRTSVTDAESPSVAVTRSGGRAQVLFDAERGDDVGFGFTESSFSSSVQLTLVDPQGRRVGDSTYVTFSGGGDWEVRDLPLSGTYSLVLDPGSGNTGAANVTVSYPAGGELDLAGPAEDTEMVRAGQDGRWSFDADSGDSLSLGLDTANMSSSVDARLLGPDGREISYRYVSEHSTGEVDVDALPTTGRYTVLLDPSSGGTGTVRVTGSHYAGAGALSSTGTAVTAQVTRFGQNAVSTFTASAGDDLSLGLTGDTFSSSVAVSVLAPSGAKVVDGYYLSSGSAVTVGLPDLPETGTYRVVVNPQNGGTGSLKLTLSLDVAAALAVDGAPVTATMARAGQQIRASFTAPDASPAGFAVTANTVQSGTDVRLVSASGGAGSYVGYLSGTSTFVFYLSDLTPGASYALVMTSNTAATGSMKLSLSKPVAPIALSSGTPSSTGTIAHVGQQLEFTYAAASSVGASVVFSGTTFAHGPILRYWEPGATSGSYVSTLSSSTLDVPLRAPLAAGTHRLVIQPDTPDTGSTKATLLLDANGGALSVGGAKKSVTIASAGQNAHYTFTGTKGQKLTLGLATPPAAWSLSVFGPDGKWLVDKASMGATTTTKALPALPADGTYTLTVDPTSLKTGTYSLGLTATALQATQKAVPARAVADHASLIADRAGAIAHGDTGARHSGAAAHQPTAGKQSTGKHPAGTVPVGPDAWRPDKANLAGDDWVTRRGAAPKSPSRLRAPPGATALTGHVLKLDGKPLAKVTVRVGRKSARTDTRGRFLLTGISTDATTLVVDGSTANTKNRQYGRFDIRIHPRAHHTTDLGFPVWMTPLDTRHTVHFDAPAKHNVVLTTPSIPGLELRIPKGSVVRDEHGKPVTELGITAIPIDRPPFPLPKNSVVPVYFTVQPGGTYVFPKGAQVVYPNYTHAAPGTRVEFMAYDPEGEGWHVYGHGQVTADGKQVVPDAKTRVWAFTGAMFNISDWLPWDLSAVKDVIDWLSGDPVDLGTGLLTDSHTDLGVADPLGSAEVTRTYWQGDDKPRAFGIGRDLSYNVFLHSEKQYEQVDLYLPGGQKVHYVRTSSGTGFSDAVFEPTDTPSQLHGTKIVWNQDGGGEWNLKFRDGTVWVFPQYSPLAEIRDRHGNAIRLTREGGSAGPITRITTPGGRWVTFTYDSDKRITQAQDNAGRSTSYTYDTAGRLKTVTDTAHKTSSYTYDGTSNRIATAKDARDITYMTNSFDTDGRVKKQTLTDDAEYSFAYTKDSAGKVTAAEVTEPGGAVRRVTFDSDGFGTSETAAYGSELARKTVYERGPYHRVDAVTDPYGRRTELYYDANGHVTESIELAGTADERSAGTVAFDGPYDQPTTVTDAEQHKTVFAYDANGDLKTVTDPENRVTSYTYEPDGQVETVKDASDAVTQYTYRYGDLVSVKDAEGRVSGQFTDAAGRPSAVSDEAGSVTRITYDALNQPREVTDPLGHTTGYTYDDNGNLHILTDARQHTTTWDYDDSDRPKTVTDPLGAQASFAYDAAGRLKQVTNRSHQVGTVDYDLLGRPKTTSYGVKDDGTAESTVAYDYDDVDLPKTITDSQDGAQSFTYDAYDRLHITTGPTGTVTYDYDALDQRKTMTAAGTTTSYDYDDSGILKTLTAGTQEITFGLDAVGREKTATLPGGITRTTGYDKTGVIKSISYAGGTGTAIGDLTYTRDARGLQTELSGSLADIALPPAESGTVFDNDNRISTYNGRSFTYDANGELKDDGQRSYTWNARGQLTGLTGAAGSSTGPSGSFSYDPLGRRASKTTGDTTGKYLTDGGNPLAEQNATGDTTATTAMGGLDDFLTRSEDGKAQVYLTDALGSVLGLANTDGTVATRYTYDPGGRTTTSGDTASNPYTFTGRQADGTGLLYYRDRYYDPETGRFISQDPAGQAGGANLYQYALSSPTTYTDPSGDNPLIAGCVIGGLIDGGIDWLTQRLSGRKVDWGQVGTSALTGCLSGMLGEGLGALGEGKAVSRVADDVCLPNSFTGDTPVLMADGTRKPIKDVRVGDKVAATDPETGESGPRTVTTLIKGTGSKHLTEITVATYGPGTPGGFGDGKSSTLTATDGHPFWVPALHQWVQASDLKAGQWLQTSAGTWIQITAVGHRTQQATVYNLTVDGLHTYYVLAGKAPVLVHNSSCPVPISKGRWDHVWDRHVNRTRYPNKSKFTTTSKSKIEKMINRALGGESDDGVYFYRFPSSIGATAAGDPQYYIRVVVRDRKLITAFPSDAP